MTWLALIVSALVGYYIGAMRAFAFNGYTAEPWTRPFDTMQPGFGSWWRGERLFFYRRRPPTAKHSAIEEDSYARALRQSRTEIHRSMLMGGGLCPNCGLWGPRHAPTCYLAP